MNFDASTHIAKLVKIGKVTAISATATLIVLSTLAPAVHAAPSDEVPQVVVKYDADKAATESGALELYKRLSFAAREVCPDDSVRDLHRVAQAHQCQKEALARAVSKVGSRHLVEIAAARANRG
jgi:UrcA family protein